MQQPAASSGWTISLMPPSFIKKMVQRCIRLSIRKENGIIV
jgi:hypothetical protein